MEKEELQDFCIKKVQLKLEGMGRRICDSIFNPRSLVMACKRRKVEGKESFLFSSEFERKFRKFSSEMWVSEGDEMI